jgi:lysyl-tRNA synthetase class 2
MSEQEINISELKKIRLEKLQELKDLGIDPFGSRFDRNAMSGDILNNFA